MNYGENSLIALLHMEHSLPVWLSSSLCFIVAAILAWASFSALLSKNWHEERFEMVALSMGAALGVAIGFISLTPQSAFWYVIAQLSVWQRLR